jgi:hypothetical protein
LTLDVDDEITAWLHEATVGIKEAAREGVKNAADWLHHDIMQAFEQNGPGWKKLSQVTIDKKVKENAPDPSGILKEWYTMRDSIQVRDASPTLSFGLPGGRVGIPQMAVKYGFFGTFEYNPMVTIYDIGLFSDYKVMHKFMRTWKAGNEWDLVNRGYTHEFGGFEMDETEEETHPIKEIVTGGIDKRGLKGITSIDDYLIKKRSQTGKNGVVKVGGPLKIDTGVAHRAKEIKQRKIGVYLKTKTAKLKYIPSRSFLRMPYDRSEAVMFWMIAWKINEAINNL